MTYAIPKARTNYGVLNIRFQGVKVWNDISDDIKLLPLKGFKNKLKSLLIDKKLIADLSSIYFSGFPLLNTGTLSFFVCCLNFFLFYLRVFIIIIFIIIIIFRVAVCRVYLILIKIIY